MRGIVFVAGGFALSACMTAPVEERMLTGEALAARLSGQEMRLNMVEGEELSDTVFIARLQPDGVAEMSVERAGKPVKAFRDTESWTVKGQALCIHDGAAPEQSDCIRVDAITGDRIRLTETKPDGTVETSSGILVPM